MSDRSRVIIESCPYDESIGDSKFRRGASFSALDVLDMVLDNTLPNGTIWLYKGVRYLYYNTLRYELTLDDDVDVSSAMRVVNGFDANYHPRWEKST